MKSILVVEDDHQIRVSLRQVFESAGYEVLTVANGQDGMNLLKKSTDSPALILLDLMLPVMTGWEVLDELKKDEKLSQIPIVVISARGIAPNAPGARYFQKPLNLDELVQAADDLCGGPHDYHRSDWDEADTRAS